MRAHNVDAGQYYIVTRTTPGDSSFVSLFDHYIGRPERRVAKALFGIYYVNLFTLEVRIE